TAASYAATSRLGPTDRAPCCSSDWRRTSRVWPASCQSVTSDDQSAPSGVEAIGTPRSEVNGIPLSRNALSSTTTTFGASDHAYLRGWHDGREEGRVHRGDDGQRRRRHGDLRRRRQRRRAVLDLAAGPR